jgi:hypothetical protein
MWLTISAIFAWSVKMGFITPSLPTQPGCVQSWSGVGVYSKRGANAMRRPSSSCFRSGTKSMTWRGHFGYPRAVVASKPKRLKLRRVGRSEDEK